MSAGSTTAASGHGVGGVMLGIREGVLSMVGRWHFRFIGGVSR